MICATHGVELPREEGSHYHERRNATSGRLELVCCPCATTAGLECRVDATTPTERTEYNDMPATTKSKRTSKRTAATSRDIQRAPRAGAEPKSRRGAKRKPVTAALKEAIAHADKPTKKGGQRADGTIYRTTDGLSAGALDPATLKIGEKLVAKYQGGTYHATVVTGGYLVKGKTYKSLSAAGNAITGNSVNGKRFWRAA